MNKAGLLMVALILEISGLVVAWRFGGRDFGLPVFLLLHAGASVLLALSLWQFLPDRFRYPRLPILLLLFNFSFFIPVAGLPGMLAVLYVSSRRRRVAIRQPFASVTLPEFVLSLREPEGKLSQVGIRSRLAHPSVPAPQRLQSLLALQGMRPRVSNPLLHNVLGDSSDDIRLVAYGLLDGREKRITDQIHGNLEKLRAAEGQELRLICQTELAELYWELVYSRLAQGDLRSHALQQALFYVDAAIQLASRETGLWLLKGRILHEMRRDDEARRILEAAIANGLPESRVSPYIAEIAFVRGDYRTVRGMLERVSASQVTPVIRRVIRFWVGSTGQGADFQDKAGVA